MSTQKIDIERITDNRFQARDSYDEIVGLARDIAWNGLLQGLTGRIIDSSGALARHDDEMPAINASRYFDDNPDAQVELVFGHRRLRAIQWMIDRYDDKVKEFWHRGLDKNPDVKQMVTSGKVPVTIRPMSDADMYAAVVSENTKRDDLNPIERARSLHIGRDKQDMSNRELAKVHDRSQSWVSNQLRLLRLPDEMQEAVANGDLSTRQAAALVPLYELDEEEQEVVDDVDFPIDLRPPTIEGAALSGASSADLRERVSDMQAYIESELSEEKEQEEESEPAEETETETPAPAPAPEAAAPEANDEELNQQPPGEPYVQDQPEADSDTYDSTAVWLGVDQPQEEAEAKAASETNTEPDQPNVKDEEPYKHGDWRASKEDAEINDHARENGSQLIHAERLRQIQQEGYTLDHDEQHEHGELAQAACSYADFAQMLTPLPAKDDRERMLEGDPPQAWPWDSDDWKPSGDPIRNLEKAGALIIAEIDRIRRKRKQKAKTSRAKTSRAKEEEVEDTPERDTDLCETTLRRLLEHEHIDHYAAKASRMTLIVAWWLAEGERATRIANEIRTESGQSNIALVYTRLPDAKQEQMRELAERMRKDAETEEATPF